MKRSRLPWSVAALCLLLACDGGKKPAEGKDGDAGKKTADASEKKAGDAEKKAGDAEKKAGDAKEEGDPTKETAKAEAGGAKEVHLDLSMDRSGVLARTAAVLETDEAIDNEDLRELSHHAEEITSVEEVCRHVAKVLEAGDDISSCVKDNEHHVVRLGPELYSQAVQCLMDATTKDEIVACEAAEREAEEALHAKPHGDGLDEKTCDEFFTHFENLAMADAGDQAELVKEVLEEVRTDVVSVCMDQGTKAEIDCAMGAKAMSEVKDCASKLL